MSTCPIFVLKHAAKILKNPCLRPANFSISACLHYFLSHSFVCSFLNEKSVTFKALCGKESKIANGNTVLYTPQIRKLYVQKSLCQHHSEAIKTKHRNKMDLSWEGLGERIRIKYSPYRDFDSQHEKEKLFSLTTEPFHIISTRPFYNNFEY